MAIKLKALAGSSENLNNVPIEEGQLIFTIDKENRQVFLDIDNTTRVEITSPKIEQEDTVILAGGGAPSPEEEETG